MSLSSLLLIITIVVSVKAQPSLTASRPLSGSVPTLDRSFTAPAGAAICHHLRPRRHRPLPGGLLVRAQSLPDRFRAEEKVAVQTPTRDLRSTVSTATTPVIIVKNAEVTITAEHVTTSPAPCNDAVRLGFVCDSFYDSYPNCEDLLVDAIDALRRERYTTVVIATDPFNILEVILLQQLGFVQGAMLRYVDYVKGAWKDAQIFSLRLRDDHGSDDHVTRSAHSDLFPQRKPELFFRSAADCDASTIRYIYQPRINPDSVTARTCPYTQTIKRQMGDLSLPWILACDEHNDTVGCAFATRFWGYKWAALCNVHVSRHVDSKWALPRIYKVLLRSLSQLGYATAVVQVELAHDDDIRMYEEIGFKRSGVIDDIDTGSDHWSSLQFMQFDLMNYYCDRLKLPQPRNWSSERRRLTQ